MWWCWCGAALPHHTHIHTHTHTHTDSCDAGVFWIVLTVFWQIREKEWIIVTHFLLSLYISLALSTPSPHTSPTPPQRSTWRGTMMVMLVMMMVMWWSGQVVSLSSAFCLPLAAVKNVVKVNRRSWWWWWWRKRRLMFVSTYMSLCVLRGCIWGVIIKISNESEMLLIMDWLHTSLTLS